MMRQRGRGKKERIKGEKGRMKYGREWEGERGSDINGMQHGCYLLAALRLQSHTLFLFFLVSLVLNLSLLLLHTHTH